MFFFFFNVFFPTLKILHFSLFLSFSLPIFFLLACRHYPECGLPAAVAFFTGDETCVLRLPAANFHPDQPSADSPKHQQKIDKNSPGSNNNGGGGAAAAAAAAALGGVGSSATLPSQGSHLPLGSVEAQLKYENDRLKLALAQR